MSIEIPESTAFYVRGAITRGILAAQENLKALIEAIDKDNVPSALVDALQSNINYNAQWLEEAQEELAKLPSELRIDPKLFDM